MVEIKVIGLCENDCLLPKTVNLNKLVAIIMLHIDYNKINFGNYKLEVHL